MIQGFHVGQFRASASEHTFDSLKFQFAEFTASKEAFVTRLKEGHMQAVSPGGKRETIFSRNYEYVCAAVGRNSRARSDASSILHNWHLIHLEKQV